MMSRRRQVVELVISRRKATLDFLHGLLVSEVLFPHLLTKPTIMHVGRVSNVGNETG